MERITVAILGQGPIADLLAKRLQKRSDITLNGVVNSDTELNNDVQTVVFLPDLNVLKDGQELAQVTALLRRGFNVISTTPIEALNREEILAACREGKTSFHGTGGFQTNLITRFNRAFATITRNISDIELVEELDVKELPVHSCCAPDQENPEPSLAVKNIEQYYNAGLNLLSDAVFKQVPEGISPKIAPSRPTVNPDIKKPVDDAPQIRVQRLLGDNVSYESVWTRRENSKTPLRYRLHTTSSDAIGHATITFHAESDVQPTAQLATNGILDALRPVTESKPGILRFDLDIYQVKNDERFKH